MKIKIPFIIWILFLFAVGCGGPKVVSKHKENATNAESAGNYEKAVKAWKRYIDQETEAENQVEGSIYARAAKTAYKAGEEELAVSWFDQARYANYADPEMYSTLATIFRRQDNFSKELSALEYYKENFENNNSEVNSRLFSLYYEIEHLDKALKISNLISDEMKHKEEYIEKLFSIYRAMDNEDVADSLSRKLLEMNPDHVEALEWNAKKYYWRAENRYQQEMEEYNKNKTTRQYRILLEELEKSTDDFKKALGFLEKLWDLNAGDRKEYAHYMATIYARFNDEQKANYYMEYMD